MSGIFIDQIRPEDADDARRMLAAPSGIVGGTNPDRVVFLTAVNDETCERILPHLGDHLVIRHVDDLKHASGRILLSFGTSIIVPQKILDRFPAGVYNIHAASPDYPGRDPHHFAVYDGATRYGATCHVMTKRVDEGPIVDVEWFDVPPSCSPEDLLQLANEAAIRIIERIGPKIANGMTLLPNGAKWGPRKTKRSDFREMCRLTSDMSREEIDRRVRSFYSPRHNNLTMDGKPFMPR